MQSGAGRALWESEARRGHLEGPRGARSERHSERRSEVAQRGTRKAIKGTQVSETAVKGAHLARLSRFGEVLSELFGQLTKDESLQHARH